jgi:hypothetical protein
MFSGIATNTCQVRFSLIRPDGTAERLEVRPARFRHKRWRVKRKQLAGLVRTVCARMHAATRSPPPDVRLKARCGSRRRWVIEDAGMTNVCAKRR